MAGEKILNIDDSPTVQRLIEMILTSQGYQVVLASDGEAGVAMAKEEKPDLILVDFVMPKMNGFQVCKTLKEDPNFPETPIILVTSKGDKVGSKFVDVLGISEYFTKPFQPEELLAKIREVLDRRKAEAAASAARASASAKTRKAQAAGPPGSEFEATIREIVKQELEAFLQNRLPELVRKELGKPQSNAPTAPARIQGELTTTKFSEVMQMLSLQRRTGKLALTRQGEVADIHFREGTVVFANANGGAQSGIENLLRRTCRIAEESLKYVQRVAEMTSQPVDTVVAQERLMDLKTFGDCLRRHTENAVYKVMTWPDGAFVFEKFIPPVFATSLQIKVDDLLIEGSRRADEWTLIQQKIPHLNLVFSAMIGNAEELTTRGLSETDMKVFSLIDGKRTIQDIVAGSSLSDFDVAKSMFILLSVNLIKRKK